jgi:ubiquitin-like 1-activating enzyme E1 B
MCLAAEIPLVESGTSGYVGQVQPIKKDLTECFDCSGSSVPPCRLTIAEDTSSQGSLFLRPLLCAPFEAHRRQRTTASPGRRATSSRASLLALLAESTDPRYHRQLYGADEEADGQDLDDAEKNGENGTSNTPSASSID